MKRNITIIVLAIGLILGSTAALTAQDFVAEGEEPEVVTDGYRFTEGPLWHPDGYLLFSDIPANRIYKWTPGEEAEVFLDPSGNANGIALDEDGNIVVAQHAGKISLITPEKEQKTIVDSYNGMRLNSPNDLVVHTSGTIYFTDPPFGVSEEDQELDFSGVFMYTPDGRLVPFYQGFSRPNGVALSPDEERLYVNDSQTGQITVFDIDSDGKPVNRREFASVGSGNQSGAADGMKTDAAGRVYSTGPGGVYIFDSEGNQVEMIETDVRITNLGWGGDNNSTLFMTAPSEVYSLEMAVSGN